MEDNKIPQIIHYCWFGKKEKPLKIKQFINNWKEILKGYKFIEWNEENFDINCNTYVKEAYEQKKYAFVSDYARIQALYKFGGIYLDTDVEVLKTFDEILNNECVLGFEAENYVATSFIATKARSPLIKEFIDIYENEYFVNRDGTLNKITNVDKLNSILLKKGLVNNGKYQVLDEKIVIYPREYFSPYDYSNCIDKRNNNTICVHHFYQSWASNKKKAVKKIKKIIAPIIGKNNMNKIRKILNKEESIT